MKRRFWIKIDSDDIDNDVEHRGREKWRLEEDQQW
jgi:hypothetical protein